MAFPLHKINRVPPAPEQRIWYLLLVKLEKDSETFSFYTDNKNWTEWKYIFSVSKDDWSKEASRNWILDIKEPFVSEERAEESSILGGLGLDTNICRCWLVIDTICKVQAKLDDHFITMWAIAIVWNSCDPKGNSKLSILKTPSFPITVFFSQRKQQWRRAKKIMRNSSVLLGPASEVKPFKIGVLYLSQFKYWLD